MSLKENLLTYLSGDRERCGFVLKTGDIVEVENHCSDPQEGFEMSGENILQYTPIAAASWHTHPGASKQLSAGDYRTFLDWPDMLHFIIGEDGVQQYSVNGGVVLIDD